MIRGYANKYIISKNLNDEFKDLYDDYIYIDSDILTKDILKDICKKENGFFYVINDASSIFNFDFNQIPEYHQKEYVHMWGNHIRLFNSDIHENCDDLELYEGKVPLCKHEYVQTKPTIYVEAEHIYYGEYNKQKYSACGIIKNQKKESIQEILETSNEYFYVIPYNIDLDDFDFTYLPKHWDFKYLHIWDNGVKMYNTRLCKKYPEIFNEDSLALGKIELKFYETPQCKKIQPILQNKIPVHYTEDFENEFTSIVEKETSEYFFIVENNYYYQDFNFSLPFDEFEENSYYTWGNRNQIKLFKKKFTDYENLTQIKMSNTHYENTYSWKVYDSLDSAKNNNDRYFFVKDKYAILPKWFNFKYTPEFWNKDKIHKWITVGGKDLTNNDIKLYPNKPCKDEILAEDCYLTEQPYDIVFLSYNEPFVNKNKNKLLKHIENFPHKFIHVNGIDGIVNAHKMAAEMASTRMFYVVDADAIIDDNFKFDYYATEDKRKCVHVWRSKNNINSLTYGYGGIKLFPRDLVLEYEGNGIDFTTSVGEGFVAMKQISNITEIDTDEFTLWKSVFRETVKLRTKIIKGQNDFETEERLKIWEETTNHKFQTTIESAIEFSKIFVTEKMNINLINNYKWIENEFKSRHMG